MPNRDKFKPTPFNPEAYVARQRAEDQAFNAAYDALKEEYDALAARCSSRKMPQADQECFANALLAPSRPNAAMKRAFKRRRKLISNK